MGPVGSGKSTACCWELYRQGCAMPAWDNGVRRSRFAIIRNTYRELEDTTLATWRYWFDPVSEMNMRRMAMTVRQPMGNTLAEMEILFRALDRPEHVKHLLSLELTGAWVNEARELGKGIIDALDDRIGRYPNPRQVDVPWIGLLLDTNPPDFEHWWYRAAEEQRPEGWEFFRQPGGLIKRGGKWVENPQAENTENLEPHYYAIRAQGKAEDHINVYYAGNYGVTKDGKPVFEEYSDALHGVHEFDLLPDLPTWRAWDFGLTPACLVGQIAPNGQLRILYEWQAQRAGIESFGEFVVQQCAQGELRAVRRWEDIGDPAGDAGKDLEITAFDVLHGMHVDIMPGNQSPETRLETVRHGLRTLADGAPLLVVHPRCTMLRKALGGEYKYRRMSVSGERYSDKPDKGPYSHLADALQYLCAEQWGDILGLPRWRTAERERVRITGENSAGRAVGVEVGGHDRRDVDYDGLRLQKSYSTR